MSIHHGPLDALPYADGLFNLVVADKATGTAMREMFAADLREATRVDADVWRHRPVWQRTLEAAAGLFGPNL